jgi:hypothetical protein
MVKQVPVICPQGKNKRVKRIETSTPLLHFCPLPQQQQQQQMLSDTPSLFIENICLTGYTGGQKSTSSKVPVHASTGILPLAMQALLVTLEPLIDKSSYYITSLQLVEDNQAPGSQGK